MDDKPILVVDDDPSALQYMSLALSQRFGPGRSASGGVQALLAMERELPSLVVSDLRMPEMDGLELLALTKERWPETPFILVTVEQEVATVVDAVRHGATNYLVKPVSPAALCMAASRALATASLARSTANRSAHEIIGMCPAILRVRHLVSLAARSDMNILITGETGTGKELVARAIHRLSSLARGPFVAHNCAVTPADLFESQFFGHRRGSFTSAEKDQPGLLEEADGGILFLDELECLSLAHQAKLLRVLDDGEVRPVGSRDSRVVSVRFLSATNHEPESMLTGGTLREDLYYRLRGLEIRLPLLRERRQDILPLAGQFLEAGAAHLSPEALAALEEYSWPGNVRQLRNALRAAQALSGGETIERRHLTLPHVGAPSSLVSPHRPEGQDGPGDAASGTMREAEREIILQTLDNCRGHRGQAARTLGIHRSTLRRKLREFGIASES
jgi:DNA-binding NtrC family response regulator